MARKKMEKVAEITAEDRAKWLEVRMSWEGWTVNGKPVTDSYRAQLIGYANTDQAKEDPVWAEEKAAERVGPPPSSWRKSADHTPVTEDQLREWDPVIQRRRDQAAAGEEQYNPWREAESLYVPSGYVAKWFNKDYIGRDGGVSVAMEGYKVATREDGSEILVRDSILGILPRGEWARRQAIADARREAKYGNLDDESLNEDRIRATGARDGQQSPFETPDTLGAPRARGGRLGIQPTNEEDVFDEGEETYAQQE
jgi:hypothetical protein